jgi:hypothetical protein
MTAYRAGSPTASGATTDAVIKAVMDSGPPRVGGRSRGLAYTSSGPTIAQSPTTRGSPATSAYAITCEGCPTIGIGPRSSGHSRSVTWTCRKIQLVDTRLKPATYANAKDLLPKIHWIDASRASGDLPDNFGGAPDSARCLTPRSIPPAMTKSAGTIVAR